MEDESIGVMSAWRSSSRVSTVFFGGILVFHVTTATRLRVARFAFRFFLAFLAKEKKTRDQVTKKREKLLRFTPSCAWSAWPSSCLRRAGRWTARPRARGGR